MADNALVVPETRSHHVNHRFKPGRGVFVALPVNVVDVALLSDDQSDRRRLVLGPVLRLEAAGLDVAAIADVMQLDLHVVEMAIAEAGELAVDHDTADAASGTSTYPTGRYTSPKPYSLAVFRYPETALLGASDRACGVFVHAQQRWSLEELGHQLSYWDLKTQPVAVSPVNPRDVLRITDRCVLSDEFARLRGAVTVLEPMRSVRLLVPLIGRDGDDIVAGNPFARAPSGRAVHDGLTRIFTGMPDHAVGGLRDRLPDLRAERDFDLGMHLSYRQVCVEELRELRAGLATASRPLVRAAAGHLIFAISGRAIAGGVDLDDVAAGLFGRPAVEGALRGLADRTRMAFLHERMDDAVTAVSAHMDGRPCCLSAVIVALLAVCRARPDFTGDPADTAGTWVVNAYQADDALDNYVATGDFPAVEQSLTTLVQAVGADRPVRIAEGTHGER